MTRFKICFDYIDTVLSWRELPPLVLRFLSNESAFSHASAPTIAGLKASSPRALPADIGNAREAML